MNAQIERTPPRYTQAAAKGMLGFALLLLAAAGAGLVLFLYNPAKFGFYPECYLYRTTGLLCPGCGSLRALHQLLHGHLVPALRDNALLVASLPAVAWWAARFLLARLRGKQVGLTIHPSVLWWALGVMLLFGILRNLPFARAAGLTP